MPNNFFKHLPNLFDVVMMWLVLGPMLHSIIEHGGAELLRLLSGDVIAENTVSRVHYVAWQS